MLQAHFPQSNSTSWTSLFASWWLRRVPCCRRPISSCSLLRGSAWKFSLASRSPGPTQKRPHDAWCTRGFALLRILPSFWHGQLKPLHTLADLPHDFQTAVCEATVFVGYRNFSEIKPEINRLHDSMIHGSCSIIHGASSVIHGPWFMFHDSWFKIHDLWCMVHDSWFRIHDFWCMVHDSWFKIHDLWCMIMIQKFMIWYMSPLSLKTFHAPWFKYSPCIRGSLLSWKICRVLCLDFLSAVLQGLILDIFHDHVGPVKMRNCIRCATLSGNKSWFARFRLLPTMDAELSLQGEPSIEFLIRFSSEWERCHKTMVQSKGKGIINVNQAAQSRVKGLRQL